MGMVVSNKALLIKTGSGWICPGYLSLSTLNLEFLNGTFVLTKTLIIDINIFLPLPTLHPVCLLGL